MKAVMQVVERHGPTAMQVGRHAWSSKLGAPLSLVVAPVLSWSGESTH